MLDFFSLYVVVVEQSVAPSNSSKVVTTIAGSHPHRARHAHTQLESSHVLLPAIMFRLRKLRDL